MPRMSIDERVEQLVSCPAGCALLLLAEENNLSPDDLTRPEVALLIAGYAVESISPWDAYGNAWLRAEAQRHGPRLRPLAAAILEQPDLAWWWDPIQRDAQLWMRQPNREPFPTPTTFPTPHGSQPIRDSYEHQPRRYVFTSTERNGISSLLSALRGRVNDWYVETPISRKLVRVSPSARIYEVGSAQDWHEFCVENSAEGLHNTMPDIPDTPWGTGGGIVPNWPRVAQNWDGVHVSLWAFITAIQVRVTSSAGWTEPWSWSGEHAIWLRWAFASVTDWPDHPYIDLNAQSPTALIPPDRRHPGWPVPPSPD